MSPSTEPEQPVTSESSESTPHVVTTDPPADKGKDKARGKGFKILPIALGGLCLVLAVVVALLGVWAVSDSNARKVDEAALEAARTGTPLVLSYAPATVNQDIETARKQVTGKFAADFDQMVNQVVLPATKQQGLTLKCTTTHAVLADAPSAEPGGRDALVIMQQEIAGPNAQGQKQLIQVKVTMLKTPEGEWKVSFLQPI